MAVLAQAQEAEFGRLKEVTGTSDSVMSKHLSALAEARAIKLRKASIAGKHKTWASLTREGRHMFGAHVAALQRIIAQE